MKQNKNQFRKRKAKYDVARFVYKHFPDAKLAASGDEFLLTCPWHDGHKKKLYVNVANGVYNCFVCSARGGFLDFVRRVVGLADHADVTRFLDALISDEAVEYVDFFEPELPVALDTIKPIQYPDGYYPFWAHKHDLGSDGRAAQEYLYKRGLTENQLDYYRLGFCIGGRYDRRVLIPTFGPLGELVTYVCRDYTDRNPLKVLNPPESGGDTNKHWVFNLYNASRARHLIICEGVFDAINTGIEGVALFGKHCTEAQFTKILGVNPLRISIMLDPDAQIEANELAQQFSSFIKDVRVCCVPFDYDPGNATREMIELALIDYKLPYSGWSSFLGGMYV